MVSSEQQNISDFWWLTSEEAVKYKYIYFCHQEPYSDEPSGKDPSGACRYFSLDESGRPLKSKKCYQIEFIKHWRDKFANINIFRSVGLFSAEQNGGELYGPFLIDIDRQEKLSRGYVQNLNKALEDTRRLVNRYLCKLNEDDFRVFFTGHKGFNIDVRPKALGIVSVKNRLQQFKSRLNDINGYFGSSEGTPFVDNFHDEIRLHNSINRWVSNNGETVNRMKFEVSLQNLNSLSPEEICEWSERLALNYLSGK